MAVNARTEEFQHIEVFDKPALFTNGRIARDTDEMERSTCCWNRYMTPPM